MQLFDILKYMFSTKESEWKAVGKHDKNRNYFMINRIMAIQYPIQANQFNKIKIVTPPVIDWWHSTLSCRYSRPPVWLYTKTNKKESNKKDTASVPEEAENFIRDKYNVSKRDLKDIKEFYPEKYISWVNDISEQMGIQKNKNNG